MEYKPSWVEVHEGPGRIHFQHYPELSIEDWQKSHELYDT